MRWWQGDLADPAFVKNLLVAVNPEVVVHLAGLVTGRRNLDLVLPTLRDNLLSTVNLLTAAAAVGCRRVLLAGSLEEPDADQGTGACSPYAASKSAGTLYGRMFHRLYRVPVVTARLFMVYGPGQQDLLKLVPYVILSLIQGTPPELTAGHRPVDWIYIDDVVDGLLAATQVLGLEGSTIDIGSGTLVPIRIVVERLVELVGAPIQPLFGALPDRPNEQIRMADTTSTWTKLRWKAKVSLDQGLAQTVAWYRDRLEASAISTTPSAPLPGRNAL